MNPEYTELDLIPTLILCFCLGYSWLTGQWYTIYEQNPALYGSPIHSYWMIHAMLLSFITGRQIPGFP